MPSAIEVSGISKRYRIGALQGYISTRFRLEPFIVAVGLPDTAPEFALITGCKGNEVSAVWS